VRPGDAALAEELRKRLLAFEAAVGELPGISTEARRITLVEQLVESDRRKRYRTALRGMNISEVRADPSSPLFDPVKAAVLADQRAHREEAFWLVATLAVAGGTPRAYTGASDLILGPGSMWRRMLPPSEPGSMRTTPHSMPGALVGSGTTASTSA
jgi:hypothetical protein